MNAHIESLPVLVLFPHARCNCRCVMCDIWKETNEAELSLEELERHMNDIRQLGVEWVVFSGGEPLMHSDLFRLASLLRQHGIRVTLLSTGILLKRYAAKIVNYISDVVVSLDGPSTVHDSIRRVPGAFRQLESGVRTIHEIAADFPIAARCTIQRLNHDHAAETAETAKQIGLRSISFLAADVTSEAFRRFQPWEARRQAEVALTLEEVVRLEREFDLINQTWNGTGFVLESREKLQRIAGHFRVQLGLAAPEAPRCNAPWTSAVIETDGLVRPCFFHKPVGSLKTHSLMQVLNSFEAQRFRMSLDVATNPVCRRCVCSLNWKPEHAKLQ
ncbi:MAG TPA: radical SAM protein [Bryobacteraceae bacterium]|jgi:MoaA/NifB/PqqE/SkfB family radical SAM enzyme|nr:radical SAM protein [Bryobacteraceae bacterium]